MKNSLLTLLVSFNVAAFACSDIFINKAGYHVETRSMDFPINMGTRMSLGFVGQQNSTNPVVNIKSIPEASLSKWTNKYGYIGRSAFETPDIIDGMNTQGLSIGILYLPGSKYPRYNPSDKRPVLSALDLGTFLLSQAKNVKEAYNLINSYQIIDWAVEAKPGVYISSIPIHYIIRDKSGDSLVVEFINGKVKIYQNAGNVLTNAPDYAWQLNYAKQYASLNVSSEEANKSMANYVYKYKEVYGDALRPAVNNLLGLPGDYTSTSRFVRASVLLSNMYPPASGVEAIYQSKMIMNSLIVPYLPGVTPKTALTTTTLWTTTKDLDNVTIRYQDIAFFQADQKIVPANVDGGSQFIDLKSINFNKVPDEYATQVIKTIKSGNYMVVDYTQIKSF